jgi:hypothetical protein
MRAGVMLSQALRAATKRSLEVLAEAEARLREEEAAKEARDAKAQEVSCCCWWLGHALSAQQR